MRGYYKIFQGDEKNTKINYANTRNKNMSDGERKRRKEYMENDCYEWKNC